jgi:DNA-binding MarR family transcriptional regulator
MAQQTELSSFDEATFSRFLTRYSGDSTNYRLLMHFWSMNRPETITDTIISLRIHRTRVRRALRILIEDGLVTEQDDDGRTTYVLAETGSTRSWVAELLRRAIHEGLMRRAR